MEDETPLETVEEKGEEIQDEIEDKTEEMKGENYGEIDISQTEPSLKSDFCQDEAREEDFGEQSWICHEYVVEGEQEGEYGLFEGEVHPEEEEEISLEEKKTLDSEYLKAVLGTPLTFALLEIASRRPTDPIQYLGQYLLNWRWAAQNKESYEEKMKQLNAEREAYLAKLREKERQEMLSKEEREEELRRAERVESTLDDDDDVGEGRILVGEGE